VESTTPPVDWQARALEAETRAKTFESKYRGLRRTVAEVATREARQRGWCGEIQDVLSDIDPLLRIVEPVRHDYEAVVTVRIALPNQTEVPSKVSVRRLAADYYNDWRRLPDGTTIVRGGMTFSATAEVIQAPADEKAAVYNPELDADDLAALGAQAVPMPQVDVTDDDDDDDF